MTPRDRRSEISRQSVKAEFKEVPIAKIQARRSRHDAGESAALVNSIKAIGMVIRMTTDSDGTESGDVRYFISSRYLSGQRFAQSVRGHWGIENSLHWAVTGHFKTDQLWALQN